MLIVVGLAAGAAYLILKPRIEARLAENASFNKAQSGGRNNVTVQINGQPITAILDSVSAETELYWKEGDNLKYGTIEDLYLSYNSSSEKDEFTVQSVQRSPCMGKAPTGNVISGNNAHICFKKIKDVVYHGIRPVWKITLRNGKSVEITKDHSIFCAKESNYQRGFVAKPLEEIGPRDGVVSIDDYADANLTSKRVEFDNDMLTFMGLWMADGSYLKDRKKPENYFTGVSISTGHEKNVLEYLKNFSSRYRKMINRGHTIAMALDNGMSTQLIMDTYKITKTHVNSIRHKHKKGLVGFHETKVFGCSIKGDVGLYSKKLGEEIFSIFGDVDSYTKRVPKFMFTATNEQIAAFLRGYFTGDGSIATMIPKTHQFNYKYGSYSVVSCSSVNKALIEDISILLDRLGIKHNQNSPYRSLSFNKHLQYKLTINVSHAVDKFVEKVGFIKEYKHTKRVNYIRDNTFRPVSLRRFRNVEFIGPKPVYDISVDETEAFVANGILCHNSGSDLTLLTHAEGARLGLTGGQCDKLPVSGISDTAESFCKMSVVMKIGDTAPFKTWVGIANIGNPLRDNLFGSKDMDRFNISINRHQITFSQAHTQCDSGVCMLPPAT